MMNKVIYLNGRRGRLQADMGLQLGADMEADVVVIAEAVADQNRRNSYGTYDLVLNTQYLAVYVRKDRTITCKRRGKGEWVMIANTLAAGYLPPHFDQHKVRLVVTQMMEGDTIIGDLNCCRGTKKRVLEELIESREWDNIRTTQHTYEWGNHNCRIDRVLTRGGGRPWAIEEGWGCLSDHKAVGVKMF